MTETKRAACKPRYKREFSIFEDETLEKLKDFRAARSNWITSNANQTIRIDTDKGFYKPNEYKGRWAFLRRKWFLTFLHAHYKTLRPPRYYTLKQKLSRPSLTEVEKMKQRIKAQGKPISKTRESVKVRSPEDKSEVEKSKKKKKTKKRKSSSDNFFLTALYPSKKAIKKLKAAKLESRMIESCRCDDGKELTVVIKGVCLCDKTSLNKFKLDKVCNEYTKLENKTTELAKSALHHTKDSLELIKKKSNRSSMGKESDEEEDKARHSESSSTKKIKFVHDQPAEKGSDGKSNKNYKYLAKSGQTSTKLDRKSSIESENSTDKEIKINEGVVKENAGHSNNNLTESKSESDLLLQRKRSNADLEESVENAGKNESTLTLYKSGSQQPSHANLTEEQSEKMKKN